MTKQEREKQIEKIMEVLKVDRDGALEILADDAEVDNMSVREAEADLSADQRKTAKQARSTTTEKKHNTKTKKEKPQNMAKANLISILQNALSENGAVITNTTNAEREFFFEAEGVTYKVVMSVPRS